MGYPSTCTPQLAKFLPTIATRPERSWAHYVEGLLIILLSKRLDCYGTHYTHGKARVQMAIGFIQTTLISGIVDFPLFRLPQLSMHAVA